MLHQRNTRGAIGVVFKAHDAALLLGRPHKIDQSIQPLVATALVPHRDAASSTAAAGTSYAVREWLEGWPFPEEAAINGNSAPLARACGLPDLKACKVHGQVQLMAVAVHATAVCHVCVQCETEGHARCVGRGISMATQAIHITY